MPSDARSAAEQKMRAAGCHDAAVATFLTHLDRLEAGDLGFIPEKELEPLDDLADAGDLAEPDSDELSELLDNTVILKLNGGLGTSMGLAGPKSLLPVRDGLTFLDLIARQVLHLRAHTGARLPLVLMNSFATRQPSLAALEKYSELVRDVPLDIVQNKAPKLRADDHFPVSHPQAPDMEWAPPGHGDLYTALVTSGMLDTLLSRGYRTMFVSNADNLGATMDTPLLGWFAASGAPFALEVTARTDADRKGGHLTKLRSGGMTLREIAQTPDEDIEAFQDITRHRYFNTNNLWIDLAGMKRTLAARNGVLDLPMIVNRKTVDPADAASTPVLQLETAMGSALATLPGAQAIRVPRSRFRPVKTTDDLLVTRSDAYEVDNRSQLRLAPTRDGRPPLAALDPAHYKNVADFEARFPAGAPSMLDCDRLAVHGDVRFGPGVILRGKIALRQTGGTQLVIPSGTEFTGARP
jgi:UTP--glucose-1-phosphate uridylyltransferase